MKKMDVQQIKKKYRRNVHGYDLLDLPFRHLRELAIARLALQEAETVLDLGCGTGLSFALLEQRIGPQGKLVGVDLSPEMLTRAREKLVRQGWSNIRLIEANACDLDLPPASVDALLCFYTHDVITSRLAMERAVQALRHGGRMVAVGGKRTTRAFGALMNLITLAYSLPFVTNLSETTRPWVQLERLLGPLSVEEYWWGTVYLVHGKKA
jgi:ubiquinone/menaquinone biosynthesis C-methylase UbiE